MFKHFFSLKTCYTCKYNVNNMQDASEILKSDKSVYVDSI